MVQEPNAFQETNGVEPPVLTITENAAAKAQEILQKYNKPQAAIRVFIKSGGCSGYQYGMA
nr:hypothetical protein [Streptococcus pneumoniae]